MPKCILAGSVDLFFTSCLHFPHNYLQNRLRMAERVEHLKQAGAAEDVASSYAVSPTASSAAGRREWSNSNLTTPRPSGEPVSPQRQSGSPREEWRRHGGVQTRVDGGQRGSEGNAGGGGDGGGGGGGREGWGGVPGKRHVDYEVQLKNPQVRTKRSTLPKTDFFVGKSTCFATSFSKSAAEHLCRPRD